MNNELLNALYLRHDEKLGVLCDNENEVVKHVMDTDLTIVECKKTGKSFILFPLTSNHKFEYHENWLKVDGTRFDCGMFWQQDGCQWVEIQAKG